MSTSGHEWWVSFLLDFPCKKEVISMFSVSHQHVVSILELKQMCKAHHEGIIKQVESQFECLHTCLRSTDIWDRLFPSDDS